jgi:hypothetical protein
VGVSILNCSKTTGATSHTKTPPHAPRAPKSIASALPCVSSAPHNDTHTAARTPQDAAPHDTAHESVLASYRHSDQCRRHQLRSDSSLPSTYCRPCKRHWPRKGMFQFSPLYTQHPTLALLCMASVPQRLRSTHPLLALTLAITCMYGRRQPQPISAAVATPCSQQLCPQSSGERSSRRCSIFP